MPRPSASRGYDSAPTPTLPPSLSTYDAVPATPDHIAIEHRVLDLWDRERTFERLRERNAGNEPFSRSEEHTSELQSH